MVDTASANAFETLGVSENGGTVDEEYLRRPIYSDIGGPDAPVDFQQMGMRCTIRFQLVHPEESVVTKLKNLAAGNAVGSTVGTPATPGTVLGANARKFKLYLPSSTADPWVFQHCVADKFSIKESTVAGVYDVAVTAWRYLAASAGSMSGAVYTRVAPS